LIKTTSIKVTANAKKKTELNRRKHSALKLVTHKKTILVNVKILKSVG